MDPSPIHPYAEVLASVPLIKGARPLSSPPRGVPRLAAADGWVRLRTAKDSWLLAVRVVHSNVAHPHVAQHAGRVAEDPRRWLLAAPHVSRGVGHALAAAGIQYVDIAGNCHLELDGLHVHVEGKRPVQPPAGARGLRAPAYQVLFALLARPELVNMPIREIARLSDVSKNAGAGMLHRLQERGALVGRKGRRRLLDPGRLLDEWLAGYTGSVRPRLVRGRYTTREQNPKRLERLLEEAFAEHDRWGWGGGAAAMRLTGYYRGEITVVHLDAPPTQLPSRLEVRPSSRGNLILLGAPGPIAYEGPRPHVVHPLLVYTELLAAGDDRAREAAEQLRERYLPWL